MNKNNYKRIIFTALLTVAAVNFAWADNCEDIYTMSETAFLAAVQKNAATYNTRLTQCVTQHACSYGGNQQQCLDHLIHYHALADFYSKNPPAPPYSLEAANKAAATTAPPSGETNQTNTAPVGGISNNTDTFPVGGTSNKTSAATTPQDHADNPSAMTTTNNNDDDDFYKNIRF